ncbi:hypothetical protein M4L38_00915 [Staphylococcus equorum]|uniref:hypothetical protein n=1 Tax=Staphylococcus equorum TaxID=246432 RepID=UPI002408909F|nr:hypothetical protein [Staphylococcus equorum]MDG0821326.1 hypothetical protein [Staphylococcus equorum]
MNEPTEIKYSLDENEEPYFAATHVKGIAGLDFADGEDLITIIFNLQNEISKINTKLENQEVLIYKLKLQVASNTKKINKLNDK